MPRKSPDVNDIMMLLSEMPVVVQSVICLSIRVCARTANLCRYSLTEVDDDKGAFFFF